jgi:hypothetical protein
MHFQILELSIGPPNIKNRPQKEHQSQQFDDNFKQSKRPHKDLSFISKVQTRNGPLFSNINPSLQYKMEIFRKIAKGRETDWNYNWKQISHQIIVL